MTRRITKKVAHLRSVYIRDGGYCPPSRLIFGAWAWLRDHGYDVDGRTASGRLRWLRDDGTEL